MATGRAGGKIGVASVRLLLLVLVIVSLFGCGAGAGEEQQLTVFAAASLTDAFEELGEEFERQHSAEVRFNFGGSSTLLVQIQQEAPADVFASADELKMEEAVEEGLAREPESFVRNRLALLVPRENPAGLQSYRDLAEPGTSLVLAQDEVPVAEYAMESLQRADGEYGEGFAADALSNLVSREQDVRAAANRVALGEADVTFVYTSDITPDIEDRVEVIEVPEEVNVTATYPIAVLDGAPQPDLAREWVDLVLSGEGQEVLEEWGFEGDA